MEWQPIETAPKDGLDYLFYDDVLGVTLGYWGWLDCPCMEHMDEPPPPDWGEPGWYGYDSMGGGMMSPTHWMPLPLPPNVSRETQEWD